MERFLVYAEYGIAAILLGAAVFLAVVGFYFAACVLCIAIWTECCCIRTAKECERRRAKYAYLLDVGDRE